MELQLEPKDAGSIKDRATIEAALGSRALGVGDTEAARKHYSEAGRILDGEAEAARDAENRNILRFLAASQYYHGGDYQRAQKLARRVEEKYLPEDRRALFGPFVRELNSRADAGYSQRIREKVAELGEARKFAESLELLKNHPFALDPVRLAYARAIICEEIKRYHAAALFHAKAMEIQPNNPNWPYISSALLLWMPSAGLLDEAMTYLQFQIKEISHPVARITASVLHYRKAAISEGSAQANYLKQQVGFFHEAWDGFRKMPTTHQCDPNLRELMSLCFELAAFAYWKLNDDKLALSVSSEGIEFNPRYPGLWNVRGMVRSSTHEGREDFRKAIELGEQSYSPYYYLAQHAMEAEQFKQARQLIEEALRRGPGQQIQGQLTAWLAICLSRDEETKVSDVFELFERAIRLAPDIPEVHENYAIFKQYTEKAMARINYKELHLTKPEIRTPPFIERTSSAPRSRNILQPA